MTLKERRGEQREGPCRHLGKGGGNSHARASGSAMPGPLRSCTGDTNLEQNDPGEGQEEERSEDSVATFRIWLLPQWKVEGGHLGGTQTCCYCTGPHGPGQQLCPPLRAGWGWRWW